jgi:hypothetical protein
VPCLLAGQGSPRHAWGQIDFFSLAAEQQKTSQVS